MQRYTANVLNHWQDSKDCLPVGEHVASTRVPVKVEAGITTVSHELQRMRTHPHLYYEWQIDAALEAREAELTALGLIEWDCDTCGRWVVTPDNRRAGVPTPPDPCPKCGAP